MASLSWPAWPIYTPNDQLAVQSVIESNQLFAASKVKNFEQEFAAYIGVKHAVAMGNATQGLHLVLAALGIGIGDEVITPNYSFVSSASCILMQNATPVFVDLSIDTLAPSADQIKACITPKTKAIIVTHLWGFPCRIDEIARLAAEHGLFLIEDASHSHGALYKNQKIGSFSDIAVFSLHQRKNLPVGDGGICVTNSQALNDKIYRLRSFGDVELSYNYRMTEFAGALGSTRLKLLDAQNNERRITANYLDDLISDIPWLDSLKPIEYALPVYHSYILIVNTETAPAKTTEIVSKSQAAGIPLRRTWEPLHRHPHFNPSSLPARGFPSALRKTNPDSVPYSDLSFPIGDHLIDSCLLQIDIHPGTTPAHLDILYEFLSEL